MSSWELKAVVIYNNNLQFDGSLKANKLTSIYQVENKGRPYFLPNKHS